MTIKSRNELKPRFNTGMYPSQTDFHNWLDSYFHKSDRIPVQTVEGIDDLLNTNNATLLNEVQKVVDSYHAIDYEQKDLSTIDITPFKHVVSIHQITEDTEIGFSELSGKTGIVKLIVENTAEADVVLSFPQMADLIVFADDDSCLLPKGCFAELIVTGYGNLRTLACRVSQAKKEQPLILPTYQKDEEKTMYLETQAQYQVYGNDWDKATTDLVKGVVNKGTYRYIRIGEYEWMSQNIRIVPVEGRIWDEWINTQTLIDEYINESGSFDPVTLDQSLQLEGAFLGSNMGGHEVDALFTNTRFYADRSKSQTLQGWKQPSVADFAQLFAMADRLDYTGIVAFHGIDKPNANYPFYTNWSSTAQNTSGFAMIPCGTRNNVSGIYRLPRQSCAFKTNVDDGIIIRIEPPISQAVSVIADDNQNLNSLYPDTSIKFYLASVRYCRQLSDDELGYKMYIDRANDQIKVVSINQTQPNGLTQLEKGKLRGRAVRWLNANNTKVLAPLSYIEKEIEATQNGGNAGWFDM